MRARYAVFLLVTLSTAAAAADSVARPKAIADVARCRIIGESTDRLACYDTAVAILTDAAEKGTIVVLDRTEVQRTRRSLFGFTLPKLPFFGNDDNDVKDGLEEVRELATTIRSVGSSAYGLWSLSLAEGGTWRTTEPSRTLEPRAGQSIIIKRGPVGGYTAKINGERAIRIQRIG